MSCEADTSQQVLKFRLMANRIPQELAIEAECKRIALVYPAIDPPIKRLAVAEM